jgi:hypothetical protein
MKTAYANDHAKALTFAVAFFTQCACTTIHNAQKIPTVTIDSTSTHPQCSRGGAGSARYTGGADGYAYCGG